MCYAMEGLNWVSFGLLYHMEVDNPIAEEAVELLIPASTA